MNSLAIRGLLRLSEVLIEYSIYLLVYVILDYLTGCGIGGRNQEMALAWAIEIDKDESIPRPHHMEIHFLSGGTDGIDGPTDAAGAVAFAGLIPVANSQGLDASSFLTNNDSYQFFHDLHHGQFHLITGHTGTNVMDVHIICFRWTNGPSAPVL